MGKIYLVPGTWAGSVSWTNAALWSTGSVPGSGDDVFLLTGAGLTFDSGLNQWGVGLSSLTTSRAGPKLGGLGTNCLQIGPGNAFLGVANVDGAGGDGQQRVKVNSGTWLATINLLATAARSDESGVPPAVFLAANSNTAVYQTGGVGGLALSSPADTSTFGAVSTEGGTLFVGPGVTYSAFNNRGSQATLQAGGNAVTVNSLDGTTTTQGTFAVGTINVTGGDLIANHRPAAGTMVGSLSLKGGTLDLGENPAPFSIGATGWGACQVKVYQDGQGSFGAVTPNFNGKTTLSTSAS